MWRQRWSEKAQQVKEENLVPHSHRNLVPTCRCEADQVCFDLGELLGLMPHSSLGTKAGLSKKFGRSTPQYSTLPSCGCAMVFLSPLGKAEHKHRGQKTQGGNKNERKWKTSRPKLLLGNNRSSMLLWTSRDLSGSTRWCYEPLEIITLWVASSKFTMN